MTADDAGMMAEDFAERLFGLLLRASPQGFRRTYGAQMRRDFKEALRDTATTYGYVAAAIFVLGAYGDVLASGAREYGTMVWRDLAFAVRSMRKTPLFTFVIVATLAVATGANATAFSILYGVVLAPLPYPQPDRLVAVSGTLRGYRLGLSLPDFEDFRAQNRTLQSFAATYGTEATLMFRGRARKLQGVQTTPELFTVLQVRPELGRFFVPSDAQKGAAPAIVISDDVWRRVFGATRNIVGTHVGIEAAFRPSSALRRPA